MIIKSLIAASIIFNFIGLSSLADKFDRAVVKDWAGGGRVVSASSIEEIALPEIVPMPRIKTNAPKASANARHYLLADLETGKILAKNAHKDEVPIASTTKIMTATVALENYELDNVVTISEKAAYQIGADSYLRVGEQITVENLLNCLLIKSGNDAAYALAEHMNETGEFGIDKFVDKMNGKAKELGMENSEYHDPAGLDVTGHSSAYDLFLITRAALKYDKFREIIKKEHFAAHNIDSTIWHSLDQSNRLVADYHYPGAIGVKTGYMPEAGHCLVGAAIRNGHTLVSIVLSTYADTPSASADESKRLLDWGFSNIVWE